VPDLGHRRACPAAQRHRQDPQARAARPGAVARIPSRARRRANTVAAMAVEWEQLIVDAADPIALGRWWQEALGWVVVHQTDEEFESRPSPDRKPGLLLGVSPDEKNVKNQLPSNCRL